MRIVNENFEFPELNSANYPDLRTKKYTVIYDISPRIFKKLRGIDNLLVWIFINQSVNFLSNAITIDSSWRKLAAKETDLDMPRLTRSLAHLKRNGFVSIIDNECRLNPFISSKGSSYKRESIVTGMEGAKGPNISQMI